MIETRKPEGKRIGKYQNAVLLAKGGMGAIYKADHPTLEKPVVLKMLTLTENEQFTLRFQREATIMMGFQHVNIVNYYDHFKTNKSYCMVMEFVDGCSVAQLLERHRYLDDDLALLILRDVLRALVFAHGKGVVHRDIKPANILISSRGDIKLTDFGIAQDQAVDTDGLTKEGMTLGTPSYMAPEQFRDAGRVDGRADLYSSGVLLYESLTGRKPFSGASLPEMLERIRKGRYEKLRKIRPDSALISRRIVRRAMRARPELRYKDASKMLRPLEGYISRRNEESLRRQLSDLVTDRRRVSGDSRVPGKRFILRWIGAAAASLAGLAVLGTVWWFLALSGLVPSFLLPGFAGGISLEVSLPPVNMAPPRVSLDVYQYDSVEYVPIRSSLAGRISLHDRLMGVKMNVSGLIPGVKDEEKESQEPVSILAVRPVILKPGLYQSENWCGRCHHHEDGSDTFHERPAMAMDRKERGFAFWKSMFRGNPGSYRFFVDWDLHRADTGSELNGYPVPTVVDEYGVRYKVNGSTVQLNTGQTL